MKPIYSDGKWNDLKGFFAAGLIAILPMVTVSAATSYSGYTGSVESDANTPSPPDMTVPEIQAVIQQKIPTLASGYSRAVAIRITELCRQYGFKASFILSVIQAESRFRTQVVSSAGAIGLMQLLPTTAAYIAERNQVDSYTDAADLNNPVMNVTLGIHYLGYLKVRHPESSEMLSAYNLGPTKYRRVAARGHFAYRGMLKYVSEIHDGQDELRERGRNLIIAAAQDTRI